MVPQGHPTALGGGQPLPNSLLRANSGLLGGQGGGMPSQNSFPSLVSPRNQFNNMNMIEDGSNIASLFHQSFGNGGPSSGVSGPGSMQRGIVDGRAESDPLSRVGNGMGFNQPASSYMSSPITSNPNSSGQVQGQQQAHQIDTQNFRYNQQQLQQLSVPSNHQQQPQQQQFQAMQGGLGGGGPVKVEPHVNNEKTQALHNVGAVKLEAQLQTMRGLGPVKVEPQQSDSSMFLHQQQQQPQQQQQQQQLLLSRQSSQVAAAAQILQQQRLMQIQQQQLLKSMPQQRPPLQPQFQHQSLPVRSPAKPVYEPGMCARRLTHYMYQQQHRPEDNNIEFWRKFVAEYFAPNAKKKWCVSMYGSGRQTTGVFPQDVWHCEICNRKPGRGFEATVDVLPRLLKIKYESGTIEELLYVDMPREYQNSSGQIVLDYAKAMQESVFDQLRVVRDGQLRIVFSPDLKICSWEFCARRHEELIPRRSLIPQVSQLGAAAQKCQAATSTTSPSSSVSELQNNCNMFVSSARQLAKALEVPLVNDLGYTKRYVRCLQISEVVNSMKDLIDYSRETGTGPMDSLAKFPQRTKPGFQQQPMANNTSNAAVMQTAAGNGMPTSSTSTSAALLHQDSFNSRRQNPVSSSNNPYGGSNAQMQSPDTMPPVPSSSSNPQAAAANSPNVSMQQPSVSGSDADVKDSESSVQKIIHDMMASQLGGGVGMMGMSGNTKNVTENGFHSLIGQGVANGSMGNGHSRGQPTMVNGVKALSLSQHDLGNELLDGLGEVNGFNDLEFDWKSSP